MMLAAIFFQEDRLKNHSFDCQFASFPSTRSLISIVLSGNYYNVSLQLVEFVNILTILGVCIVVAWILIQFTRKRLKNNLSSTEGFDTNTVVRRKVIDTQSNFPYQNKSIPSVNPCHLSLELTKNTIAVQNHIEIQKKKMDFIQRVGPGVYGYSSTPGGYIDDWRPREIPSLILPISSSRNIVDPDNDEEFVVYLDYAGSVLPTETQMREHMAQTRHLLGNPHSMGPASARTQQCIEQAKKRILDHFHAHPGKFYGTRPPISTPDMDYHPGYDIVFTSGTTDALRIVAEHFPWKHENNLCECQNSSHGSSLFVYPQNSHTSVVGMREVVLRHTTTNIVCQPIDVLIETILQHASHKNGSIEEAFQQICVQRKSSTTASSYHTIEKGGSCGSYYHHPCRKHLLVLPMECNFGGDQLDVQLVFQKLQEYTMLNEAEPLQRWYTLLDMAKAASTSPINLCQLNPDFACISFYKMFGDPTGIGCLFVKRTAMNIFSPTPSDPSDGSTGRRYVGGGSVDVIVPGMDFTVRRSEPTISLTHGTPHFRGIVALLPGFNELDRLGGMHRIHQHTQCLAQEFVRRLRALQHNNGQSAVMIYGDWKHFSDLTKTKTRMSGPTVAFNVLRADGSYIGYNEVSKLAGLYRPAIQLRTGCFCNPGACQLALELSNDDVIRNYKESGHVCGDPVDIINGRPTGAVRVSFGKDSIWEDMNAMITFLELMFVNQTDSSDLRNVELAHEEGTPNRVIISELYIFPIKSCAAQRVSDWPIDILSGRLRFDREFALVDASGSAMRLQMYPSMALLRPTIDLKAQTLTVKAPYPSHPLLELNLDAGSSYQTEKPDVSIVKVCGNRCAGILWGDHAVSDWFSQYLGVRCWLARHSGKHSGCYELPAQATTRIPLQVFPSSLSFANEQPLLLISEHGVQILNEALRLSSSSEKHQSKNTVCSRHFRPNIVVRLASDSYPSNPMHYQIEDHWTRISAFFNQPDLPQVSMIFDVVGPCARCAMVDIDPSSGCKGGETLRALARYRRRGNGQITFGIFLRVSSSPVSMKDASRWQRIKEGDVLWCE